MAHYKAPLRDIQFVLEDLLDVYSSYQTLPGYEETTPDLVNAVFEEAAKFSEEVLTPLNAVGDKEGCQLIDGEVKTPTGFKEAYQEFVAGGWPTMEQPVEYGGQGLPLSIGLVIREMIGTANWSWGMYPGLSHGATVTIFDHGTEAQKETYLKPLTSGEWTGTMCLTEAHCGTDLGLLKSKAEPNDDGSYRISGSKIFISAGEHDLTENIVHIVLARLPDAPEGTKGISLFIVPKFIPAEDGSVGDRNAVSCGSLEHKMGIHGNATCVLNFDGATGYMLGEPNKGLRCMFTFMNVARLGTGIQGLAHTELAFQNSLAYAKDRLAMRSLTGTKNADGPADPIIVHPDVRRMLLTQKAFAEGGRVLIYFAGTLVDTAEKSTDPAKREEAESLLGFLTPIIKAFITETGSESANLGMQCFGGHGYISEWGMEQNVRDARIATLYEGTTGIQSLDLLGRKVLGSRGKLLKPVTAQIIEFCKKHRWNREMRPFVIPLWKSVKRWKSLTRRIGFSAMRNKDQVGAASVDYLMYSGYVLLGFIWAKSAYVSQQKLSQQKLSKEANTETDSGNITDESFYQAKIQTAEFYFAKILPRTASLQATIKTGSKSLMAMAEDDF
ncbi:MAG: acyl-CoA dehydrogenase C-terminal domain-containing protein [Porticoccus sp.]|nr:acyl-CoA dehydrogenase C-terminal domain-containing protein [Porticoccus sp.]MBQ0808313.1 acyl-CoA dehydrogenase C-terminal domain-containing protein [Porticoccus sp.]MDX2349525.1 acyl-CoA dehydrogenase C-terminal domain-containing protein [Porticoccus sp.]